MGTDALLFNRNRVSKIALGQAVFMFFKFSKSIRNEGIKWSNFHRSIKGKENAIISNGFRNVIISNVKNHPKQCCTEFHIFWKFQYFFKIFSFSKSIRNLGRKWSNFQIASTKVSGDLEFFAKKHIGRNTEFLQKTHR